MNERTFIVPSYSSKDASQNVALAEQFFADKRVWPNGASWRVMPAVKMFALWLAEQREPVRSPITPDADGDCARCGIEWEEDHECAPGFLSEIERVVAARPPQEPETNP